jgi:hypothetical protein
MVVLLSRKRRRGTPRPDGEACSPFGLRRGRMATLPGCGLEGRSCSRLVGRALQSRNGTSAASELTVDRCGSRSSRNRGVTRGCPWRATDTDPREGEVASIGCRAKARSPIGANAPLSAKRAQGALRPSAPASRRKTRETRAVRPTSGRSIDQVDRFSAGHVRGARAENPRPRRQADDRCLRGPCRHDVNKKPG